MDSDEDAARWGQEARVSEYGANLMVDQVILQTRGQHFSIRYYALRMALSEETHAIPVEELKNLLCAAVVALAVERENL